MKILEKRKNADGQREIRFMGIRLWKYRRKKPLTAVEQARALGVRIGERVRLTAIPESPSPVWGSEPYLIEIGDDCVFSFGITFLTHDASIRTSHRIYPEGGLFTKFGRIRVGNEVFIGCRVIIMPGVTIGNRCVIGAGSVVTRSIPDGEVWAGNPARFICTSEQLAHKQYINSQTPEHQELEAIVAAARGGRAILPSEAYVE